jgi:hypothetical protein
MILNYAIQQFREKSEIRNQESLIVNQKSKVCQIKE